VEGVERHRREDGNLLKLTEPELTKSDNRNLPANSRDLHSWDTEEGEDEDGFDEDGDEDDDNDDDNDDEEDDDDEPYGDHGGDEEY
jgi:hypothetical protein